jgi:hypothetical protein
MPGALESFASPALRGIVGREFRDLRARLSATVDG